MQTKITSRDNQKLKFARRVREGKIPRTIFIEGVRLAEETVKSEVKIYECFFDANFCKSQRERQLIELISQKSANINEVESKIFQTIADTQNSQGIILIAEKPENSLLNIQANTEKTEHFLFLHEINNPSNLGAILRTAEAAGISGVIISKKSTDAFSPKALRSAMGASLRIPIWEKAEFGEVLRWAEKLNLISTAADINAEKTYTEIDWSKSRLIIFGSEANGLSEENRLRIDELIYIPMENSVESLNLAVSCGIILYEAKRFKV